MENRKIIISHGDKGGVGKSMLSALLIEHLLDRDGSVLVVEGDQAIADVAARYTGVPGVTGIMASLARPDRRQEAIASMFEAIEAAGGDAGDVVVNTPASVGETLDDEAALIVEVAHEMGYLVHVAWMLGADDIGPQRAVESRLAALADRRVAVCNERFAAAKSWHRHPARQAWLAAGGLEIDLPELTDRAADVLRGTSGRIVDLTAPEGGQPIVIRSVIRGWLGRQGAMAAAAFVAGDDEGAGDE